VTAPSGGPDDGFGGSVAVAGDTMVVGDPFATVGGHVAQGAVYVFGNVGGVWVQQAKLTASDGAAYSDFGYSVAISGSTVVVGAPTAYVNGHFKQGAVYVYAGTAGAWTQQAKLTAPDGFANDQLGYAVALSGTTLLAGAAACPTDVTPEWTSVNSLAGGRAYVYTESGGVWTQQTKLSDPYGGCLRSVGVSGNTAVIGINSRGGEVFTESDGAWTPQTTLAPSDLVGYSAIGRAVAISGDTVALGVPGAAYVFSRSAGVWTQQAKLTAADGSPSLGISVAISDGTLVAGAPGATVTDGTSPGAAYVFSNAGGTWTQQSRLTAADGAARDEFGYSVAVSGGTVATGAPLANSLQGSAYVFGGF
jgi:hypothetical protein